MRMRELLGMIALLILSSSNTTSAFLAYEVDTVGARAAGMGGAFVAIADDITALYWNPAGLGQLERIQVEGTAKYIWQGRDVKSITGDENRFGFSSINALIAPGFAVGAQERAFGTIIDGDRKAKTSVYSISSGYGMRLWDGFFIGAAANYITERSEQQGTGGSLDLGLLGYLGEEWNYGAVIRSWSLIYSQSDEKGQEKRALSNASPLILSLGVSRKPAGEAFPPGEELTIGLGADVAIWDWVIVDDNKWALNVEKKDRKFYNPGSRPPVQIRMGLEKFFNNIPFRGGVSTHYGEALLPVILTAGTGWRDRNLSIDISAEDTQIFQLAERRKLGQTRVKLSGIYTF
ncbi:MAG: hypothetical protein ACUVXI_13190 [bacterium]